ncbi:MAG: phospholipase D-like domain-containing protein [Capsulimonas sp.]|uniref:phospholipase D-like domain-containing protein n=1 Tax=Capsulimonas sp. TaxID=2494211 RepID=UPI003266E5BE
MSLDVIDNRRLRLASRIYDLIGEGAHAARFAVGYLFLDGLVPLREQIEHLHETNILIGNVVSRVSEEQVRVEADARLRGGEEWVRDQEDMASTLRSAHDLILAETALNLRRTIDSLPRCAETHALLLTLARRIADGGLKIRLYTHGFIHAKVSLIDYPEGHTWDKGIAVVGSSNVTLGKEGQPTEMNVVVREPDNVADLSAWFEDLWSQSQDFHRVLFDELGQSWALQKNAFDLYAPAGR